jgi:hypothetical protein
VAVTRAKALVIIVGNPAVLVNDPNWAALLAYVYRNKGWVGDAPPAKVLEDAQQYEPAGTPPHAQ